MELLEIGSRIKLIREHSEIKAKKGDTAIVIDNTKRSMVCELELLTVEFEDTGYIVNLYDDEYMEV